MRRSPALLLVVVTLAGCGGEGPSASEEYADSVCSNLSEWVTDVDETIRSLTESGLSTTREDIEAALVQTRETTDTLVDDLEQLGPPDTEDGRRANSELDGLATQLPRQLDAIQQALDSGGGVPAIAAEVSTAVSAAANAVSTTYQALRELDPGGELRDAFASSDECNSLGDQLENIRS